jgi:molecular chaperone GrpE
VEQTVNPRVEPSLDDVIDVEELEESTAEAPNPTVVEDLDDLLFAARRERDEYLDLSRRVQADFENYKKRMVRQQTDNLERAAEDLVTKVLPVLDAFDLARAHLGDGDEVSPEGKALVAGSTLLADTLAREGLERIGAPGELFDPTTHEAVEHVSAAAPAPFAGGAGTGAGIGNPAQEAASSGPVVDEVLRPGYRWKGRVIRPAMVRVRG